MVEVEAVHQLEPPTEILVTRCSAVLQAALVQQPGEQLRRLDQAIRQQLRDKQQIICDMFRVPREHFQVSNFVMEFFFFIF